MLEEIYVIVAILVTLLISYLVGNKYYSKAKSIITAISAAMAVLDQAMEDDQIDKDEAKRIYEAFHAVYDEFVS